MQRWRDNRWFLRLRSRNWLRARRQSGGVCRTVWVTKVSRLWGSERNNALGWCLDTIVSMEQNDGIITDKPSKVNAKTMIYKAYSHPSIPLFLVDTRSSGSRTKYNINHGYQHRVRIMRTCLRVNDKKEYPDDDSEKVLIANKNQESQQGC